MDREDRTQIKVISRSGRFPAYETEGSSGMDIRACLSEPVSIGPGERKLIPTGLFLEIPRGLEAQIRARSGLSIRHGITLVNVIGTIDSDYRGEVMVPVINLGDESYTIEDGDRIAQMVIASYVKVDIEQAETIDETERGSGGFGSTGSR